MKSLNLTVTSPVQTFAEPMTLAEAQAFLSVPVLSPVDSESDSLIEALISAARVQAEMLQGRDLVPKQWDLTLDEFCGECIALRPHLASVDLVRYRNSSGDYTTLTENTDFVVDTSKQPGIITPPYGSVWPVFTPWPSSAVLIRFTCGLQSTDAWWAEHGPTVKMGMRYLISHWYTGRLPFELGASAAQEYPYTVTHMLSSGAVVRG